jgi:hypothetical protein
MHLGNGQTRDWTPNQASLRTRDHEIQHRLAYPRQMTHADRVFLSCVKVGGAITELGTCCRCKANWWTRKQSVRSIWRLAVGWMGDSKRVVESTASRCGTLHHRRGLRSRPRGAQPRFAARGLCRRSPDALQAELRPHANTNQQPNANRDSQKNCEIC